jgi:hypothetical protein
MREATIGGETSPAQVIVGHEKHEKIGSFGGSLPRGYSRTHVCLGPSGFRALCGYCPWSGDAPVAVCGPNLPILSRKVRKGREGSIGPIFLVLFLFLGSSLKGAFPERRRPRRRV